MRRKWIKSSLDQFNKSFDDEHLTTAARETMSQMLARLFYRRSSNETLLLETASWEFVRGRAIQGLDQIEFIFLMTTTTK